jgi:hypothetical protein
VRWRKPNLITQARKCRTWEAWEQGFFRVGSQDKFPPHHCSKFRSSLSLDSLLVHEISLYCLRFDANSSPKFRPRMASVVLLKDYLQMLRYQDLIHLDVYRQAVTNWADKIKVWRERIMVVLHLSGNSLSRNWTPTCTLYKALVLSAWGTDEAGDKSSPHPYQQYGKFVCVSFGTNLTNTPSSCKSWLQSCGGRRTPIKWFFVPSSQNTLQLISHNSNTYLDRLRLVNSPKLWSHSMIGGSN